MGTPEFGCLTLQALSIDPQIKIELVVSQPDARSGRNMRLTVSPIKQKALELGLEVETPSKVSTPEFIEKIKSLNLDATLVLAYGKLLKQDLLNILPGKFVNIHASLLPRWRGAAPIQRAIMSGDKETGLSFQVMHLKLDSGPIIFKEKTKIQPEENSLELANRLSLLSSKLVCGVLKGHINNKFSLLRQDELKVTYAKKIEKSEGLIDWTKKAQDLHDHIRGLKWGPGAYTYYQGKRLKISDTKIKLNQNFKQGYVESIQETESKDLILWIGVAQGLLGIKVVQPEGKSAMKIRDFISGYGLTKGQRFS